MKEGRESIDGKTANSIDLRLRSPTLSRPDVPRVVRFAVCDQNTGYEASLERNKISIVIPDAAAERDGDIRALDESGEDYLFAADRFVAVDVPAAVRASLLRTA